MGVVVFQCPSLSQENLTAFQATDPLLNDDPIFVFHGVSATANASSTSNSRMQIHIYTPAGLQSYPRLAISPGSPHYDAVNSLPRSEQGDEVCRGIAFGLSKYFLELPEAAKSVWIERSLKSTQPSSIRLFSAEHAAKVTEFMKRVADSSAMLRAIDQALATQSIPVVDVNITIPQLPKRSSDKISPSTSINVDIADDEDKYGPFTAILDALGRKILHAGPAHAFNQTSSGSKTQSSDFARIQKERIRFEICQLLDTEDHYVEKLEELVACVNLLLEVDSGNTQERLVLDALSDLLERMLKANSEFLDALLEVVAATENAAIDDIERTAEDPDFWGPTLAPPQSDATGAAQLAECFLAHVPGFGFSYVEYTKRHSHFGHNLKQIATGGSAGYTQRLNEFGEQRLMSLLIEPIQRLPRYRLYIENILDNLPSKHPAVGSLQQVVGAINNICSIDSADVDASVAAYLRKKVVAWPQGLNCPGKVVTAVAATELLAPYSLEQPELRCNNFILIFMIDHLLTVRKSPSSQTTASRLAIELQSTGVRELRSNQDSNLLEPDLVFDSCIPLNTIEFSERNEGQVLVISPFARHGSGRATERCGPSTSVGTSTRLFLLQELFEGKVSKLIDDVITAKVECRLTSAQAGSACRHMRKLEPYNNGFGLISSITEAGSNADMVHQHGAASIQISIYAHPFKTISRKLHPNVEIDVNIFLDGNGFYTLECEVARERATRDKVTLDLLVPVLCKRIEPVLQMRNRLSNPDSAASLLNINLTIIRSLQRCFGKAELQYTQPTRHRPQSPVKALAGFFSNPSLRDAADAKKPPRAAPLLPAAPTLKTSADPSKNPSQSDLTGRPVRELSNVKLVSNELEPLSQSLEDIENTLQNYVLALSARKGNIVGKNITSRHVAEVDLVERLSSAMMEPNANLESAAQVSADVLFVAFEQFLKTTWRERMGPIIDRRSLTNLQLKAELNTQEFPQFLEHTLDAFSPQNKRAFQSILLLTADLIEFMGNDADKGILTAALCEILIGGSDSHCFIPLFDRLVEEWALFPAEEVSRAHEKPLMSDSNTTSKSPAMTTGSANSKTSSLGKRLGFGSLRRSNSKADGNSHTQGVQRQKSKSGLSTEDLQKQTFENSSVPQSRGSPYRRDPQAALSEPVTLDTHPPPGPRSVGPLIAQLDLGSPFSSEVFPEPVKAPRKKRRSSLSDIEAHLQAKSANRWTTPTRPIAEHAPRLPLPVQVSPLAPSPQLLLKHDHPVLNQLPLRRSYAPLDKGNISPLGQQSLVSRSSNRSGAEVRPGSPIDSGSPESSNDTVDSLNTWSPSATVPRQRSVLRERPNPNLKPPRTSPTKTTSLSQPQSSRNLEAQISSQAQAIVNTKLTLQEEIKDLKTELLGSSSKGGRTFLGEKEQPKGRDGFPVSNLPTRITALESRMQHLVGNLQNQNKQLESNILRTTQSLERKCQALQIALQQRDEECEAVYERGNAELMRLFAQVKEGKAVDELRQKLQESLNDAATWRSECVKLRRDDVPRHNAP